MKNWSLQRWGWVVGLTLVIAFIIVFFYYTTVQRPMWDMRKQAINTALAQTPMEVADRAELSHNELGHVIVFGKDETGQEMIVWTLDGSEVSWIYANEGMTQEEIEQIWRDANPQAKLIRIVPSWYDETYAWEIYYKKELVEGTRTFYDYYRFDNGEFIVTYTMALSQ